MINHDGAELLYRDLFNSLTGLATVMVDKSGLYRPQYRRCITVMHSNQFL